MLDSKYEYFYNNEGQLIERINYDYKNGSWVKNSRTLYFSMSIKIYLQNGSTPGRRVVLKGETNYKYELRTDCLRALPCNDGNICTVLDSFYVFAADGQVCKPCMGIAAPMQMVMAFVMP